MPAHILPSDTKWLTVGTEHWRETHLWLALARREIIDDPEGKPLIYRHIPAYGEIEVPSDRMPLRDALHLALGQLHTMLQAGFVVDGTSTKRRPDQWWIDCNFETDSVLDFIRIATPMHLASKTNGNPGSVASVAVPPR